MASIIIIVVITVLILAGIVIFNNLVRKRNEVKAAWSTINVQLQRRYDLIPNLVDTVKGYMTHERDLLEKVTMLRSSFQNATSVNEIGKIESEMASTLGRLFVQVENYPDLKASQNFLLLQEELVGTENKVAYSRQGYNNAVMYYNNAIESFPAVLFAEMMGFTKSEFFEMENPEAKNAPKVSF